MPRGLARAIAWLALSACGPGQDPAVATASPQGTATAATSTAPPESAQGAAGVRGSEAAEAATGSGAATVAPAAATETAPAGAVFRIVGFRTPRSVLHDPEADVYLVSNVNGDPAGTDDDDNGFISRVSPDGKVLDLKWIDGTDNDELQLSAPMGMAISGPKLWVADRNQVHAFDLRTGRHRASYKIHEATALADVAILDGAVIVSDNGSEFGGSLFRIGPSRQPAPYLAPNRPGVGHPQGLYAPGDGSLWVTSEGELYRVAKRARTAGGALPKGALDGIAGTPGGELFVASHDGIIFRGAPRPGPDGALAVAWTELCAGLEAPADIGYDAKRHRLLIPLVLANAIEVRDLPPPP
ncbi:MAG TPA: hypothetical protein VNO30_08590 [Kofleriaceae bacterium]|nr:hypothetical protein [Kofleriaceae bacterium]